ncbi:MULTISPECIES: 2-hydroxyacid dehydrogenase [Trueperella]|uniref:Glyoxylate/hydroxypyruvate reductase A n=1 Tax=Trueperella bernardiae TaxID=59561 RepID=A0A0W1KLC2_9ACTO|nr:MULTISPECIES: 2-hydroxyacid dehydrogenase [Trueperella]KTF04786.1 Glyoxylate/hydroxypyruvate reductase A [Trueperella bernardiae]MCM3907299.1 2-hydroxyacid dehydrogenase [Trueperella bernardiae]MDV6238157.1 2-hydroxyacid dehydrogenase [Trueperella bernardiae]OFS65785.1 hypothetical protein HMPREF3174_06975 [Trueperella sp. HMSC08H06]OFS75783.1 hypothetical protein HMPREF3167_02920 [Trueperella sp. HMSC08B05]
MTVSVSIPQPEFRALVESYPGEVEIVEWNIKSPAPQRHIDMVLTPFVTYKPDFRFLEGMDASLIQTTSIGFDQVIGHVGDIPLANAATVHETATAELTLGLLLVMQRQLQRAVRSQDAGHWDLFFAPGLADKKVLLIGYGGVGKAIASRLEPFEVELVRAASSRREDELGTIYGPEDLPGLLPQMDIVIVIVPGAASTNNMVDEAFLASMKDGALLVNMARGAVADTDALVRHADRLRIAFDVVNPEPLPEGHPLYTHPNVFFTPHVGGYSDALWPRLEALLHRQIAHLEKGEPVENRVN